MYPSINAGNITLPDYESNLDPNSPLGGIVASLSGYLKSQPAYQDYNTYAKPQEAVFNNFANNNLIPEFTKNNITPFRRQSGIGQAINYGNSGGVTSPKIQKAQSAQQGALDTQLADVLEGARGQYEQFTRNLYNQDLTNAFRLPTSFTNL